jgi:hypothetical protein
MTFDSSNLKVIYKNNQMSPFENQLVLPMQTGGNYERSDIFSMLLLNEVQDVDVAHESDANKKILREEIMEVLTAFSGHSEDQSERPENNS